MGGIVLAVVVALVVLYHDGDKEVPVEGRYELLRAIPSNAVAVGCLSHVGDLASPAFSGFKFTSELSDAAAEGQNKIILSSGGKQMHLEILSPSNAQIFILPAEGGEGNLPNPDHLRVGFTAQLTASQKYEMIVKLTPVN